MSTKASSTWVGRPLKRREDRRLLSGRGRFLGDLRLPGMAYAAILRSPHAHARIVSINPDRARAAPGVLAVVTGDEVAAASRTSAEEEMTMRRSRTVGGYNAAGSDQVTAWTGAAHGTILKVFKHLFYTIV